MGIIIPKGALIDILYNGNNSFTGKYGAHFILNEEINLQAQSTFGNLYDAPDNSFMDLMGMLAVVSSDMNTQLEKKKKAGTLNNFDTMMLGATAIGSNMSGKYKEFGFQVWKKSEPLNITLSGKLYATYNAKEQVYYPCRDLLSAPLPTTTAELDKRSKSNDKNALFMGENDTNKKEGDIAGKVINPLIPPGPSVLTVFGGTGASWRLFNMKVGNIRFKDVFIKSSTVTFNKELMEVDGILYPMSADVKLDISSIYIMTKGYVYDEMMSVEKENKETNSTNTGTVQK